jgi:ATP-dependent Clp endopeptidase proteolytic subunit ClpP
MNHEIRLYGPIGGMFGIDADAVIGQIPQDAKEITVRIHSPGGSVGDGLALYHALRDHAAHVVTIVDGYAASAASFVMLAGDEVRVHRNSIVMVHNPWTQAAGNSDDLRRTADALDVHTAAIVDIYKRKTGKTEDELRDLMDDETYFRGIDAKDMGFADTVLDDYEEEQAIAAMLRVEQVLARIQTEEKTMSKMKTRQEIAASLEEAQAIIAQHTGRIEEMEATVTSMTAEHVAEIEGMKAEHAQAVDALQAEIEAKAKELELAQAAITEAQAELTTTRAALAESEAAAQVTKSHAEAQAKEIQTLKAKLENPAFGDVAGIKPIEGDGDGEGAEMTKDQALSAYSEIEDPAERKAFREQHKAVLGIK